MKKFGVFALTVAAVAVSASTAEDQAYLAILVETKVMKIVGMPEMEMPELPPGVQMPPGFVMPGKPQKTLNVRLWSPSIAPANATAVIAPPAGLKVGPSMELELYRPSASEDPTKVPGFDPDTNPNFTIKVYWGSSDTVREGQPKVIRWTGLTDEQKAEMKRRAAEAAPTSGGSYFYKPNWTTGYWPTKKQPGAIAADASLVGKYALTTSYTGNVEIDVPQGVDFLAPISLTSPKLENEIPFDKAIPFQWNPIAHALGQYASIIGMEGENTLIIWSSSETYVEGLTGDMGFLQMAEVRDHVAKKIFMPQDQTKAVVPAGIFKNADFAMMNMVAYGPGTALEKAQPLPRVQTKSTLNVMLGGKDMVGATR